MRFILIVAVWAALPVAAQRGPTSLTLSSGYASGFEAGGVHAEARFRFAPAGKVGLEPVASWTKELPYSVDYGSFCYYREGQAVAIADACTGREGGGQAFAVGTALTYRTEAVGLPLGLDGAHAGVFGQVVLPLWWDRGHRLGAEVGVDARVHQHVRLGADVQVSRFTSYPYPRGLTVSPVVRLTIER